MDLQKLLGFPLDQVRVDPDGTSMPPEVSPLAPPTKPRQPPAEQGRQFQATRIEGLEPPPPRPAPPPAAARATVPLPPLEPAVPPDPAPALAAASDVAAPPGSKADPARAQRKAGAPRAEPALSDWLRELSGAGELLRQRWGLLALSSALLGFGAAVLVALLVRGAERAEPPPARRRAPVAAPVAAPAAPVALREPCARQREPVQLLRGVSSTFGLEARPLPGGVEVLVGLATSNGTALGVRLNATTLASTELLRDSGARELLGVVPQPSTSSSFVVDRATVGGFREWRTLPDRPELALARTNRALHLIERGSQREHALWPLAADEELSRARLEWQDAGQLALVVRRGGRQGKLVLGWLQPERGERSALRELPFSGGELGLPSLATRGDVALVAAAVRESSHQPWHIELASSTRQGRSRRLELPVVAAPGHESFAPSLTALPGARWFLQWTEGEQGLRQVRGVTLDAGFAALGEPSTLSPAGASAGGGSALTVDEGVLSLFLVQRASGYELWATTLSCR